MLSPYEERELLPLGYGITNLVPRATNTAAALTRAEYEAGVARLAETVCRYRPRIVAILGVEAYRKGFREPTATIGRQPRTLAGAILWVLPNPSGLNAHYQLDDLAALYRELRWAAGEGG